MERGRKTRMRSERVKERRVISPAWTTTKYEAATTLGTSLIQPRMIAIISGPVYTSSFFFFFFSFFNKRKFEKRVTATHLAQYRVIISLCRWSNNDLQLILGTYLDIDGVNY